MSMATFELLPVPIKRIRRSSCKTVVAPSQWFARNNVRHNRANLLPVEGDDMQEEFQ
jgi:hypothetical protein